jgi:hypothetical protein
MVRQSILLTLFVLGCSDPVSSEHGSGTGALAVSRSSATDPTKGAEPDPDDPQTGPQTDPGSDSIAVGNIEFIEVDESAAAVPRRIRVDSSCRVTDDHGLDAAGDAARCSELYAIAIDQTTAPTYGCGANCVPNTCTGTVRIHLNDGRDLVRDIAADRCSVAIPSVPTHKFVYGVWYSAGGE